MKLLITKNKTFVELDNSVTMKANDFGVWFWEDFFTIDGERVESPDLSKYDEIYEDFNPTVIKKNLQQTLF